VKRYDSTSCSFNPYREAAPAPQSPVDGAWELHGTAACRDPQQPDLVLLVWTWERVEGGEK
jgi:hypothetical protein